jgi:hypothetical protein
MPATDIRPVTEDHTIIKEMAQKTDVKTIGMLKQTNKAKNVL